VSRATRETKAVFIEKYNMYYPSKQEFVKLAKKANLIPVYKEILADTLTPVSAFQKTGKGYSYLLESVEGQEKIARFSFIGTEPSVILRSKGNSIEVNKKGEVKKYLTGEPLKEIEKILNNFKAAEIKGLPRFSGGLVGYMGYDMVRFFERLPDKNPDDLQIPDSILTVKAYEKSSITYGDVSGHCESPFAYSIRSLLSAEPPARS